MFSERNEMASIFFYLFLCFYGDIHFKVFFKNKY